MARGTCFGVKKDRGHVVTTINKNKRRVKPSSRKGKLGRRTKLVR